MKRKLIDLTLKEFFDELASKKPTPGGGSAAALEGALAASLVSMVCRLTISKRGYESVQEDIKQILRKSENLRKKLTALIDKDSHAYQEAVTAYKTGDKKAQRNALKKAAKVPLDTAILSDAVVDLAKEVTKKGNKRAISDAKVACLMAVSALKGAIENVRINLNLIDDKEFEKNIEKKIKILN